MTLCANWRLHWNARRTTLPALYKYWEGIEPMSGGDEKDIFTMDDVSDDEILRVIRSTARHQLASRYSVALLFLLGSADISHYNENGPGANRLIIAWRDVAVLIPSGIMHGLPRVYSFQMGQMLAGKAEPHVIGEIARMSAVQLCLPLMLTSTGLLLLGPVVFRATNQPPEQVEMATEYFNYFLTCAPVLYAAAPFTTMMLPTGNGKHLSRLSYIRLGVFSGCLGIMGHFWLNMGPKASALSYSIVTVGTALGLSIFMKTNGRYTQYNLWVRNLNDRAKHFKSVIGYSGSIATHRLVELLVLSTMNIMTGHFHEEGTTKQNALLFYLHLNLVWIFAYELTTHIVVGKATGAERPDLAFRLGYASLSRVVWISTSVFVISQAAAWYIARAMVDTDEQADESASMIRWGAMLQFLYAIRDIPLGILRGVGKTWEPVRDSAIPMVGSVALSAILVYFAGFGIDSIPMMLGLGLTGSNVVIYRQLHRAQAERIPAGVDADVELDHRDAESGEVVANIARSSWFTTPMSYFGHAASATGNALCYAGKACVGFFRQACPRNYGGVDSVEEDRPYHPLTEVRK